MTILAKPIDHEYWVLLTRIKAMPGMKIKDYQDKSDRVVHYYTEDRTGERRKTTHSWTANHYRRPGTEVESITELGQQFFFDHPDAEQFYYSISNISMLSNYLVELGLVRKEIYGSSKRLFLTEKGEELVEKYLDIARAFTELRTGRGPRPYEQLVDTYNINRQHYLDKRSE